MTDTIRVITLGIGPSATIDGFVLFGLNPVVVAVDYYYVVTTPRGERIYPYNIIEGVTATINPLNVWALPPEYNSTTLYIPTPGASLYLNQPGCGLTLDLLSPDYWILEDESGEWGFEDGTIMGVG